MKLGKLNFRGFAAEKPLTLSPSGKFLTAREVLAEPSLQLGSTLVLSKAQQVELAVKRYKLEPDFKLHVLGVGILTKKDIISHIKKQDHFGEVALEAEMGYCNELIAQLTTGKIATWPEVPKKTIPGTPDWKPVKPHSVLVKVKTRALFCENTTDAVTGPFANYRIANVHPVFKTRGYIVVVLQDVNDIRASFVPQAKHVLTVFLGGIGHGAANLYTGHLFDRILEVGRYDPAEVSKKAVHFLSCKTAAQLGPDTITKGAYCYAGYTENFTFVWDVKTTGVNEFELFAKSDSMFDVLMANGATAGQAYNAGIQAFNAALVEPGIPGSAAGTWLKFDRDHFVLLGKAATTIAPFRYIRITLPLKTQAMEDALVEAGTLVNA